MSTNEFDRLIQDKFDDNEFAYKPEAWDKLSRSIDITPPHKAAAAGIIRWLPKAGIAAGVALAIGLTVFFLRHDTTHVTIPGTATIQSTQPATTVTQSPEVAPAPTQQPVQNNTVNTTIVSTTAPKHTVAHALPQVQKPANNNINNVVVPQANNSNEHIAQTTTQQPATQEKKPAIKQPKQPVMIADNAYFPDPDDRKTGGKTSFSLAGGVNYGSLNTGYTVGVSARRKLGNGRFYLEGDLAVVNNTAQKGASISPAQYDALNNNYSGANSGNQNGSGGPAALAAVQAPVKSVSQEQALNNLYYLQVSPSVGYSIRKNISVSVGADVQRLLQNSNNDETPVVLASDAVKLIPQTDVGLTGKAEYGVTRRLKAGMLYREGVNALVDNKYLNRRYVQVQLRFMLFGK